MGIFWGLATAFGFGTADYVARGVSERFGAYRTLLYAHMVSLVMLLLVIAAIPPAALAWGPLAIGAALGVINTLGTLLLYRALGIGTTAIVSPISSSFGAVTLILALLSGDQISTTRVIMLALIAVGIMLATSAPGNTTTAHRGGTLRGVPEALGSAVAFGVFFWGLKYIVDDLGPWIPVAESRITTLILFPLLARPLHQSIAPPPRADWWRFGLIALLDTLGNVSYNYGVSGASSGLVAMLGSLVSPVTVLLAFVLLRERLTARQWWGVGTIFFGTAALAVNV